MTAVLRSELLKLRTTRTIGGITIGLLGLVLLLTLLGGLVQKEADLLDRKNQFGLLATGSLAVAFAAIVGVMAVTNEFRHGTIRPTLLAAPKRTQLVVAKVVASALVGLVLGAVSIGLSFTLGRLILHWRGIPFLLDRNDVALVLAGGVGASALWAAFGAGVGAAARNQVGAIVGLLVWLLVAENIIFGLLPSYGRYLPGQAANALTQIDTRHQLAVLPGTLLFLAYVLAVGAAGAFVTERRDVS